MLGAVGDLIVRATDRDYPPVVHFFHCIISIASYRQWRASEGQPRLWLYDLFLSLFSHSQGGGAVCTSLLDGIGVQSALRRADYCHYHVFVHLLTYYSPRDLVYRWATSPRNPLRLVSVGFDSLDGFTSTCGLIDKCQKNYPQNRLLPLLISVLMYNGSGFFRWIDQRARGKPVKTFLAEPGTKVARAATYGMSYLLFGRMLAAGKHRRTVLVRLSLLVVALEVLEDAHGIDVFEILGRYLRPQAYEDAGPISPTAGRGTTTRLRTSAP